MPPKHDDSMDLFRYYATISEAGYDPYIEERKEVKELLGIKPVGDYFLSCSATADPIMAAHREEMERKMFDLGAINIRKEQEWLKGYAYAKTMESPYTFAIKKVIFNNPATIVYWMDGTKTVVKRQKGDRWNAEKGLAMCFMKKALGNKGNFNDVVKKYCEG